MKLNIAGVTNLAAMMAAEITAGEKAVTKAVGDASNGLKTAWRGQITSAGLGQRLARTIRSAQYPKGKPSLNAAALVWSQAPVVVGAHDTGPLIRSRNGFWLAIPTPAAGKSARGGRITPGEWERRRGLRLRFIYRPRGRCGLALKNRTRADHRADLPAGPASEVAQAPGSRSGRKSSTGAHTAGDCGKLGGEAMTRRSK